MTEFLQFTVAGIASGALYGIVAIGLVLLYRGTRVLNFAHGEFGAVGAYAFWHLYYIDGGKLPLVLALIVGLAVSATAGVATERFIARPLRGSPTLLVVVATLAVAEILRFGDYYFFGADAKFVPDLVSSPVLLLGPVLVPAQRLLIFVVSLALAAALIVFLRRSTFGLAVRGASEDLIAVRLRGVPASRITMFVWGGSAVLSGISAIVMAPVIGLSPYFMTGVLIRAFAAALLGGMTSIGGAIVGGLAVGLIENYLQMVTSSPGAVEAALFAVIVLILLFRPQGLFGSAEGQAHMPIGGGRRGLRLPFTLPELTTRQWQASVGVVVALLVVYVGLGGERSAFLAAVAVTYAIVGLSVYILTGLAGQLSLGHAALMGAGGFGAAFVADDLGLPYGVALAAGGLIGALAAVVVGAPSFRIKGLYLAVSTLAFGIASERFLFRLSAVTGGTTGISLPSISTKTVFVLSLITLFGAVVLAHRVAVSKAGRAFAVLNADETIAESWGIGTARFKLLAFALSGFLAGVAGVLYSTLIGHITSEAFPLRMSIELVAMSIVGGLGSISGVIAGSVLFALLPEVLRDAQVFQPLVSGAVVLGVILFLPSGVAQLWQRRD